MRSLPLCLILFLCLASCSSRDKIVGEISLVPVEEQGDIPSCVDTVVRICLQTPDNIILNNLKSVVIGGGMIIASDMSNNVYGFNSAGEYVCQYGGYGESGEEYINMSAFTVTDSNQVVICDSYSQKILFFDLRGDFLKCAKFKPGSLDMVQQCVSVNDSTMVVGRYIYNDRDSIYAKVDLIKGETRNFAAVPMHTANIAIPVGQHSISVFDNNISYIKPLDPVVYRYVDTCWIDIDNGQKIWPEKKLKEITDFDPVTYADAMNENVFLGYSDVYELDRYIFLGMSDLNYALIDKTDWTMRSYRYHKDDKFNFVGLNRIIGYGANNILIGYNTNPLVDSNDIFIYTLKSNGAIKNN